jgi:hypothetical protein
MRGALHVLAVAVLLPYLVLAYAFLVLGHAISSGSLFGILDTLLTHFVWMIPWGIIGASFASVAIVLLGVIPGVRRLGALCLGVLAAAALAIILVVDTSPLDLGALLFLLPCFGVLAFAVWMWSAHRVAA